MATIKKGDCVGIVYWNGNKWIVHDGVLFSPKEIKEGKLDQKTKVTILHFNKPNQNPECLSSTPLFILKTTAIPHETAVNCVAIKNPSINTGACVAVTINSGTDIKNGRLLCPVNSPNKPDNVWINHWKFVAGFKPTSKSKPPNMKDVVEESKQYTNANKVKEVNVKDWTCS